MICTNEQFAVFMRDFLLHSILKKVLNLVLERASMMVHVNIQDCIKGSAMFCGAKRQFYVRNSAMCETRTSASTRRGELDN